MEHLSNALKQSLEQNQEIQERLLSTIDKMADGLVAASRQALSPIGRSCQTVSVLDKQKQPTTIFADKTVKEQLENQISQEITPETTYIGRISELDRITGTCKLSLDDDADTVRTSGQITDPLLQIANNPYVQAFANNSYLRFKAKAQLSQDGDIVKLFISDVVLEEDK